MRDHEVLTISTELHWETKDSNKWKAIWNDEIEFVIEQVNKKKYYIFMDINIITYTKTAHSLVVAKQIAIEILKEFLLPKQPNGNRNSSANR